MYTINNNKELFRVCERMCEQGRHVDNPSEMILFDLKNLQGRESKCIWYANGMYNGIHGYQKQKTF